MGVCTRETDSLAEEGQGSYDFCLGWCAYLIYGSSGGGRPPQLLLRTAILMGVGGSIPYVGENAGKSSETV